MIYRLTAMMILYLMTPINATPQNIPPQQIRSSQDISEIDSLNSQIAESKKSADWWQNGYLIVGFVAVVFAALTAYFQYEAVTRARTGEDSEEALGRLKESGFIASLKDKDVRIAELDLERVAPTDPQK